MKDKAIVHYEAALIAAFPKGASGDVFHHWNEARKALEQEKALQALHNENERLGLYKDAYGQLEPMPVIDKSAAIRIATSLGWTPKSEWQGLTDEEVFNIWLNEMPASDKVFYQKLCRSVEAKLKAKNGFFQMEKNT